MAALTLQRFNVLTPPLPAHVKERSIINYRWSLSHIRRPGHVAVQHEIKSARQSGAGQLQTVHTACAMARSEFSAIMIPQ
jgi:hypothetical protein